MVQLTFWTVLALCLSIDRAANGGEVTAMARGRPETKPWSCFILLNNSRARTVMNLTTTHDSNRALKNEEQLIICTNMVPSNSQEEDEKCSFSITTPVKSNHISKRTSKEFCACLANGGTTPNGDNEPAKNATYLCTDEKSLCYTSSANRGPSMPCWEVEVDDDCYASIRKVCHEKGLTTEDDEEADPTATTIVSSNRMTGTKGIEPTTAFSPELSTEGTATFESNSEPLSSSSAASEASPSYSANGSSLMTQPSAALMSSTFSSNGVVVGSVIGVLVILIIAVLLIVIFCRRYRGGRVSFDDRLRGVDIIEATNGQRNPAYSLVQGIPTADDSSHHPQSMNIYSESPTQNPSTTNNDEDDTILVDNDLYGHQQPEQNFPNQTVLSAKENATVDNRPQRDSAYSLVQSVSTTDASLQPPVDSTPSGQKPSPDGNQDTILVENDLYGCQQAPKSTYETALRVSDNDAVDNVQTSSSLYSLVQRVSTADDPSEPQAANTCSESSSSQRPPSADNNDRILVDNDLYNC